MGSQPTRHHREPAPAGTTGRGDRRYRDRHGRGLRGPLTLPPLPPLTRTKAERFDELVLEAAELIKGHWQDELASVHYTVEDVPPEGIETPPPGLPGKEPVPLGRASAGVGGAAPCVVVYRYPLEARTSSETELGAMVYRVAVEETANLLGLEPETVDPLT